MTPRQARTERRAAERKAKKAEIRRNKQAALELCDDLPLNPSSDRQGALPPLAAHTTALGPSRASINRANAQHSTGPRSPAGKLASSRNSLKHGLASGALIIPGEDPAAFESLLRDLLDEHQPSGPTEELLVNEMAQSHWLAQRALRLQNECFTEDGIDDKRLSLYMRYHSTHERAFHKALTALMKLKKERARGFVSQTRGNSLQQPGFVSQNRVEPPSTPEFVSQNARPGHQNAAPLAKKEAA